jgi:hypothetical protein
VRTSLCKHGGSRVLIFMTFNEIGAGGHPNIAFRPDSSGWYTPVSAGRIPVRLAYPPGHFPQPNAAPPPPVITSPDPAGLNPVDIHDFWKGRLAPFPGFSSRPGIMATKPWGIKIVVPTHNAAKPQLLSPRSFASSENSDERNSPSSMRSIEVLEKSEVRYPLFGVALL